MPVHATDARTVDTDILKPDTGALAIARPTSTSHSRNTSSREAASPLTPDSSGSGAGSGAAAYAEPVSEGEDDEEVAREPARGDEDRRAGLAGHAAAVREAVAWREQMLAEREKGAGANGNGKDNGSTNGSGKTPARARDFADGPQSDADDDEDERTPFLRSKAARARALKLKLERDSDVARAAQRIDPLAPSDAFDRTLRDRLAAASAREDGEAPGGLDSDGEDPAPAGDDRVLERSFSAPRGKKIAVPVRIEPKVFFALERTFLVRDQCCATCARR
jgi:hypothetical protein